jgi:hypothetical protein
MRNRIETRISPWRPWVACALVLTIFLWPLPATLAPAASSQPATAIRWGDAIELTQVNVGAPYAQVLDPQGHISLAYLAPNGINNQALEYAVFTLTGTAIQQPRILAPSVDQNTIPYLVYDSAGALHCAWIISTNSGFAVQQETVSAPHARVETLYQSTGVIEGLNVGADAQGRTFFTWLDQRSNVENLAYEVLRGNEPLGPSRQLTHVSQVDELFAPQVAVYPDGMMAVTVLISNSGGATWQLDVYHFGPDGTPAGAPLVLAQQLIPSQSNELVGPPPPSPIEGIRDNPLAVQLDAQQRLHIVWAMYLQLSEATLVRSGNALSTVVLMTTLNIATFLVLEATMDYLGFGIYDRPTLGNILYNQNGDAIDALLFGGIWWWSAFPGIFLMLAVLSINFIGDGLSDALNVRGGR